MNYEKEFYKFMINKKKEIDSLAISKKEKIKLYLLLSENVRMYEQTKIIFKMYQSLEEIVSITKREICSLKADTKQRHVSSNYILFSKN